MPCMDADAIQKYKHKLFYKRVTKSSTKHAILFNNFQISLFHFIFDVVCVRSASELLLVSEYGVENEPTKQKHQQQQQQWTAAHIERGKTMQKWPISLSRCIVPYMRTRISINVNYMRIHDQGSFWHYAVPTLYLPSSDECVSNGRNCILASWCALACIMRIGGDYSARDEAH